MDLPPADWNQRFRRSLRRWYARHARDLPWRRQRDAYSVWVSEIMLQQTQVVTVIPYFQRFLKAFPTVQALARAKEETVLKHWEGLGYYRRARQLHRAAKQIVKHHGGTFPTSAEEVDALPGIGRYTRGAILSIAFDQRQPILEANTIRLFARLLHFEGDTMAREGQSILWAFAEHVLPRKQVGDFNQALMELGNAICTPKDPRCLICPVAALCPTRARGSQSRVPRPKQKTRYETVEETVVVLRRRQRVLLRRCGEEERFAGLWDFPRFPTPTRGAFIETAAALTGLKIEPGAKLTTIKHGVTRFRITLHCHEARVLAGRLNRESTWAWATTDELADYPLSATGRKIASVLMDRA